MQANAQGASFLGEVESKTLASYSLGARSRAELYESGDRFRMQERMRSLFRPDTTVLELGCGSGADASALLHAGVHVSPTDGSQEMLSEAIRLHPELAGRASHLALPGLFPFPSEHFDGCIATTFLMHFSKRSILAIATELWRVMKTNSTLYAVVIPERDDLNSQGYDSQGRYFNGLDIKSLSEFLERKGFVLESSGIVPDALGRTTVRIEEGVFKKREEKC